MGSSSETAARTAKSPTAIARMFGEIAPRYDLANAVLSGGLHDFWRRAAAADLVAAARRAGEAAPARWLDACGGTGDFALAGARAAGSATRVVSTDFAGPMLTVSRTKLRRRGFDSRVTLAQADALQLPFGDGRFDALTVAFGIRNVADPRKGLREFARVLRPGGWCGVLEFGMPALPGARGLYGFYFDRVLPVLGARLTRADRTRNAYAYLRDSVHAFPSGADFSAWMRDDGFDTVTATPFLGGGVWWYLGRKRGCPGGVAP